MDTPGDTRDNGVKRDGLEDTERRHLSASQGERPVKKPNLTKQHLDLGLPVSRTEKINSCLSAASCGILVGQPALTNTKSHNCKINNIYQVLGNVYKNSGKPYNNFTTQRVPRTEIT